MLVVFNEALCPNSIGANKAILEVQLVPLNSIGANKAILEIQLVPLNSIGANKAILEVQLVPLNSIGANKAILEVQLVPLNSIGAINAILEVQLVPLDGHTWLKITIQSYCFIASLSDALTAIVTMVPTAKICKHATEISTTMKSIIPMHMPIVLMFLWCQQS